MKAVKESHGGIDVLIHSVAFAPEIKSKLVDTTRAGYWTALSISAYSLTGLVRAGLPLMENRPDGASVVGLTYLGGVRVVPHYGGGMSTAKAALEIDAKQLAHNVGSKGVRVNLISAGPYASRAARAIGDMQQMIDYAAQRSPLAARHHAGRGGQHHRLFVQPAGLRHQRPRSLRRLRLQRHGRLTNQCRMRMQNAE